MNATRVAALCVLIASSLALPASVVYGTFVAARSFKPLGNVSKEFSAFRTGCMKEGELWYSVLDLTRQSASGVTPMRVHRLNLESGVDQTTDLQLQGYLLGWGRLIWLGERLYYAYISDVRRAHPLEKTRIYQAVGSKFVDLDSTRFESATILGSPFEYEGRLTVVEMTSLGKFHFVQWVDGRWIDGQEILLPGSDRGWYEDAQRNRKVLMPLTSVPLTTAIAPVDLELNVVRLGGENLIFELDEFNHFFAWRRGFEFADEFSSASAIVPANAVRDVSGWAPLETLVGRNCYVTIQAAKDDLFLSSWSGWSRYGGHNKQRIVRFTSEQRCEQVCEDVDQAANGMRLRQTKLATNSAEANSYLIEFNNWNSFAVRRIEGNIARPSHVIHRGREGDYLAHWGCVVFGLLLAWLLHVIILVIGVSLLTSGQQSTSYEFGTQLVSVASPTRRSLAFGLDLLLALAALIVSCRMLCGKTIDEIRLVSAVQLCETLYVDFEGMLHQAISQFGIVRGIAARIVPTLNLLKSILERYPECLVVIVSIAIGLFVLKSYLEGRFGVTPGKWLLGIQDCENDVTACRIRSRSRAKCDDLL